MSLDDRPRPADLETDPAMQPDPSLQLSTDRPPSRMTAWLVGLIAFVVVAVVMFALNRPERELASTASPSPAASSQPAGSSPPASGAASPSSQSAASGQPTDQGASAGNGASTNGSGGGAQTTGQGSQGGKPANAPPPPANATK